MSVEVDILLLVDDGAEAARLADLVEGVAGEWSPFEEQHGFSIDGVDQDTAVLPEGWRARLLVKVQNRNTAAPSGRPRYIGWCLDKKTCASPNSAPSARRTRSSSPRSWTPGSSMLRSSPPGWPPCQAGTLTPHNARSPGWMPGQPERNSRDPEWFAQHDRSGPDASLREPRVLVAGDLLPIPVGRSRDAQPTSKGRSRSASDGSAARSAGGSRS